MDIRLAQAEDWMLLKQVRLAALLDTPTAFGVSHHTAVTYTDEQWRERASPETGTQFWLSIKCGDPVGLIGAGVSEMNRYNLIGMWIEPQSRGSGTAARLVDAVKSRALQLGHKHVYLDVSPENARAVSFYLKQGFVFMDEWEPLMSHPHIMVQAMCWSHC